MAERSRSRSRGRGEAEEADPIKQEFIDNLQKLMHFYNQLEHISPQFNPIKSYLPAVTQLDRDRLQRGMSISGNIELSSNNIRFENQLTSNFDDLLDDQQFKPAKDFQYETNPYDWELLETKEEQVALEVKFLDQNAQKLLNVVEETNSKIVHSEQDIDPLQNSNVKWFETATQAIHEVEQMNEII